MNVKWALAKHPATYPQVPSASNNKKKLDEARGTTHTPSQARPLAQTWI